MTLPLVFLAVLSVVGGWIGIPEFLMGGAHGEGHGHGAADHGAHAAIVPIISLSAAGIGLGLSFLIYGLRAISAEKLSGTFAIIRQWLLRKYYIDDVYNWLVINVQQRMVAGACYVFEKVIVMGLGVNGTAWVTSAAGRLLRRAQTGVVQSYAMVFFIGVTLIVYALMRRD